MVIRGSGYVRLRVRVGLWLRLCGASAILLMERYVPPQDMSLIIGEYVPPQDRFLLMGGYVPCGVRRWPHLTRRLFDCNDFAIWNSAALVEVYALLSAVLCFSHKSSIPSPPRHPETSLKTLSHSYCVRRLCTPRLAIRTKQYTYSYIVTWHYQN